MHAGPKSVTFIPRARIAVVCTWRPGGKRTRVGTFVARVVALYSTSTRIAGVAYAGATACTEGAERALIGDHAPVQHKGTAFGIYHLVCGLLALAGALLFGILWQTLGQGSAFSVAATITLLGAGAFLAQVRRRAAPR